MNMPRFTAEASLYKTSGPYRPHRSSKAVNSFAQRGEQTIRPQLFIDPFRIIVRQVGTAVCRVFCEAQYSGCLDTCEGTIDNPASSLNCVLCDQRHASCLQVCG
jgi:hypothetical protein